MTFSHLRKIKKCLLIKFLFCRVSVQYHLVAPIFGRKFSEKFVQVFALLKNKCYLCKKIVNPKNTMINLSQIFPPNYPDMPTWQDIEWMFQDILNRSDSVELFVYKIDQENCPYYKEALVLLLEERLPEWYLERKEIAGNYYGNDWKPYWQQPKDKIAELLRKYRQQQELEPVAIQQPVQATLDLPLEIVSHQQALTDSIKKVKDTVLDVMKDIKPPQPIVIHMPIYINSHVYNTHNNDNINNCNLIQGSMYDTQIKN